MLRVTRNAATLAQRRSLRIPTASVAAMVLSTVGAMPTATVVSAAQATYPTTPPVQVCGNDSLLSGPATQLRGSVRVDPGVDLNDLTRAYPAGTTFWLAPGTHTLGITEWGQVIPKDNNTYIGAPGAVLDGQRLNRYAFTQGAVGVTVRHLTIQNFVPPVNEGVVNQSAARGWRIEYNTVRNNKGAGVFLGTDNVVSHNCLTANGQYGFSMYKPQVEGGSAITNIVLDHNEISYNNSDDLETQIPGCGCTGGGKFWDVRGATITHNWVHHNKSVGLWADTNNVDFLFESNYINDNDSEGIWYEISYNAAIRNNTLKRNNLVKGSRYAAQGDRFPITAIYIAESGGDSRVSPNYNTLEISGNLLEDNWGGVMLWEAAERFCNSPANTSSGYCTKVNPTVEHSTCVAGVISQAPYYSDCRWKTQNVLVANNDFKMDKTAIGCEGPYASFCGVVALHSKWGTPYPVWSPYLGTVIQDAITFRSNNRYSNNRYHGDWRFRTYVASANGEAYVTWDQWRTAPYNQDGGSMLTAGTSTTATSIGSATTTSTTIGTSTTAVSPPPVMDPFNMDTSGLEDSMARWWNWYSAEIIRSTQAAGGSTQ